VRSTGNRSPTRPAPVRVSRGVPSRVHARRPVASSRVSSRRPDHPSTPSPRGAGAVGASRPERRRAARTRRNRLVLTVAVLASAAIVGAWFPASTLLHQRQQLAAAATQLSRLDQQNAALRHQEKQLRTPATIGRMAQQQYDLVAPGDQAYQVLPPSGTGSSDGTLAPERTSAERTRRSGTAGEPSSGAGTTGSFFGRVLHTLEFWR
jgi:cell division protein FtsB